MMPGSLHFNLIQILMTSHSIFRKGRADSLSRRLRRSLPLLPLVGAVLACSSCSKEEPPKPSPPPQVTDTKPVGTGLKVIGFAVLGASVVCVLGRMLD